MKDIFYYMVVQNLLHQNMKIAIIYPCLEEVVEHLITPAFEYV